MDTSNSDNPSSNQPSDSFLSAPISWWIEIITHSPPQHLYCQQPLSRLPDIPDFSPRIVRYEIGVGLRAKDPTESLVKVFLYKDSTHCHAEVWLKHEWDQSNTKIVLARQASAEYTLQDELAKAKQEAEKLKFDAVGEYVNNVCCIRRDKHPADWKRFTYLLLNLEVLPSELEVWPGIRELLSNYGKLK